MFTCKQVSRTLNNQQYNALPIWKRILIKLHVKLCVFCGKYNKQVIDNHDLCHQYIRNEDALNEASSCKCYLDERKKASIREKISESLNT